MKGASRTRMLTFDRALAIVRAGARPLGTETAPLGACLGRVLREDVRSDVDMPPFDKSAMDGYACRSTDCPGPLKVVETVAAGRAPRKAVRKGACSKIMTGAPLPRGADCVVMVEDATVLADGAVRLRPRSTADNVCRRGEDVRAGRLLASSGERITPRLIASLALAGRMRPRVSVRPRVAVLATGDELVPAARAQRGAAIRDTNSPQILAQAAAFGCATCACGIAKDEPGILASAIRRAAAGRDLLLITGGVSMGDYDLVPDALRRCGFQLLFEKVAMQPGKPTVFGRRGRTFVFGLPGNPVSSFVVFEFLVQELLAGLLGLTAKPASLRLRLAADVSRRRADRLARVPVRLLPDGRVEPVEYHGSAHVTSLARADGLVTLPAGVRALSQGACVDVRPI